MPGEGPVRHRLDPRHEGERSGAARAAAGCGWMTGDGAVAASAMVPGMIGVVILPGVRHVRRVTMVPGRPFRGGHGRRRKGQSSRVGVEART